ncbi:hypothetical protein GXP70_12345 [Paenibacillus lycopersici]|uniref:Uncharacterized protein n=1 Tax=Paenibacillus lycopersici TaxID=2704462 RepID=A0A6C0FYV4_9BACL|nr:hypothetical protein [Paenibacillus lycopersici]QHT60651.1 hypothetical protein GXP70_12345 [Paenibacillus lycopersici]
MSKAAVERVLDAIETRAEVMRAKGDAVRQSCYEYAAGELRKALADG